MHYSETNGRNWPQYQFLRQANGCRIARDARPGDSCHHKAGIRQLDGTRPKAKFHATSNGSDAVPTSATARGWRFLFQRAVAKLRRIHIQATHLQCAPGHGSDIRGI